MKSGKQGYNVKNIYKRAVFPGLRAGTVKERWVIMVERQFAKDEVIFREGEEGKSFFRITDGTVAIYVHYGSGKQYKLTELKKGQFFGEMAVIEAYPRSATAVAESDVRASEISSGETGSLFEENSDMVIDMMKHLSKRILELTFDYTEVCEIINELHLGADPAKRKESLAEKIKKFVNVYKNSRHSAEVKSVESLRKLDGTAHNEGFSRNIESFKKGTVLFKEGEEGNCMYDIHFGSVGIYKGYGTPDEQLLAKIPINRFFGEIALLEKTTRSATAVTLEDKTTLEAIDLDYLKELFEKNPPKVELILAHLSYRLRRLTVNYIEACKLLYDVSDAEEAGNVSDEMKKQTEEYRIKLYD